MHCRYRNFLKLELAIKRGALMRINFYVAGHWGQVLQCSNESDVTRRPIALRESR